MDLKEFIKEVVTSVHDGVNELCNEVSDKDGSGSVNPVNRINDIIGNKIDFDVALTVTDSIKSDVEANIGGKLQVRVFSLGGERTNWAYH
ncbi:MAG: hypothetical protein K0U29_05015 [Gammaproteobacteria bacterium]|nr:hypothetical protein [Gammaproteobacteria bacterium]MCH9744277.1 hypothetical protein [Gammaproteobacteria bacterium]